MTTTATLAEFIEALPQLLERVQAGESVVITQYGCPVAHLVPPPPRTEPRVPGIDTGKFTLGPEFFEPLPDDLLDEFYK